MLLGFGTGVAPRSSAALSLLFIYHPGVSPPQCQGSCPRQVSSLIYTLRARKGNVGLFLMTVPSALCHEAPVSGKAGKKQPQANETILLLPANGIKCGHDASQQLWLVWKGQVSVVTSPAVSTTLVPVVSGTVAVLFPAPLGTGAALSLPLC